MKRTAQRAHLQRERAKQAAAESKKPLSASDKVLLAASEVFGSIQDEYKGRDITERELEKSRAITLLLKDATIEEICFILLIQLVLLGEKLDQRRLQSERN